MNEQFNKEYLQLGLKIAYYRKLKGYTQETLAEKIDRSAAFIGHVEAPISRSPSPWTPSSPSQRLWMFLPISSLCLMIDPLSEV